MPGGPDPNTRRTQIEKTADQKEKKTSGQKPKHNGPKKKGKENFWKMSMMKKSQFLWVARAALAQSPKNGPAKNKKAAAQKTKSNRAKIKKHWPRTRKGRSRNR